ncbi:MAG: cobalamin B12-binding domain-containing protein [Armatimonadetes bacterium]|nr:cobalamin B12-binding domain-containing protein [Armatimonadota bacterium]
MSKKLIAGALGNCVHVAGVVNFLRLAESIGWETVFLGPAVSVERFAQAIEEHRPDVAGVSFRLTPEVASGLFAEFKDHLVKRNLQGTRLVFGGTPPVCRIAKASGIFERAFDGLELPEEVIGYLKGSDLSDDQEDFGSTQIERLDKKKPYPLLRHHFGRPTMEQTVEGIRKIAESRTVDVISIGPDQNAQESFFRPEEMDPTLDGAGGVPIRSADDLRAIYEASRCGNFPLLRIYSGTRDLIKWAELALETINNAWAAIPLCWYSTLDGRSPRSPEEAIRENQEAMAWYAERGIPVEVNESHHWSLRDAHDALAVAMAYLAAYNAKAMGVAYYIAQYMFNTPPNTGGAMDLAKMLAKAELIESLHDDGFRSMRQVRAGLTSLSPDMDTAKGQLAASAVLALGIKPHIMHVVGFSEGDHVATADDVIESCKIVRGVLKNCLFGMPEGALDPHVVERRDQLKQEAMQIVEAIRAAGKGCGADALTSPENLAMVIRSGILDAPHLKGNKFAAGLLETRMIDGAVYAVEPGTDRILSERDRLHALLPPDPNKASLRGTSCT